MKNYWNKRAEAYREQLRHAKEQLTKAQDEDMPKLRNEIARIQAEYLECVNAVDQF